MKKYKVVFWYNSAEDVRSIEVEASSKSLAKYAARTELKKIRIYVEFDQMTGVSEI